MHNKILLLTSPHDYVAVVCKTVTFPPIIDSQYMSDIQYIFYIVSTKSDEL